MLVRSRKIRRILGHVQATLEAEVARVLVQVDQTPHGASTGVSATTYVRTLLLVVSDLPVKFGLVHEANLKDFSSLHLLEV